MSRKRIPNVLYSCLFKIRLPLQIIGETLTFLEKKARERNSTNGSSKLRSQKLVT
jgi:hypothetical protein